MRVSAKAEYACVAMLALAANYGETQPLTVKAIADEHGIPARFLVQILLQLKASGLVTSTRGALGGYQLVRAPHLVSLADVIRAIDPPPPRRPESPVAPLSSALRTLRLVWKEVQAEEQRLLEECTLAELVRRVQAVHAPSYQI
jgi:Rrf2 family transcriptional regulator, cysteine metabolism repressor